MGIDKARYVWRKLTERQRGDLLEWRKLRGYPWHSPQHQDSHHIHFHVSAACYEHKPHIGYTVERMEQFCDLLLGVPENDSREYIVAWCILPNHYHLLVATQRVKDFLGKLGRLHGRTSYNWNHEQNTRGRKVWHNAVERAIRSEAHYWATINYIHHNPVHHGYVTKWEEWPFSSASDHLKNLGRAFVLASWRNYPILDYGKGWDAPEL
ncbi:MAG: hypothetical protein AB1705_26895 [Verrucomicrobiota bacterium]